jgi:glycosylphosphatidylinositol transamidase (GPIT) subunit GPI8
MLRNYGVPAQNIILMMNGDFVENEQNPYPGTLYTDKERNRNYTEGLKLITTEAMSILTITWQFCVAKLTRSKMEVDGF